MSNMPRLGHAEREIIEIYNRTTSTFVRDVPGAFEFFFSAVKPEIDKRDAIVIMNGLAVIHDEFSKYDKVDDGNSRNPQRKR